MLLTDPKIRTSLAQTFLPPLGIDLSPEFLECLIPCPKEELVGGGTQGGKSTLGSAKLQLDISYLAFLEKAGLLDRSYLYWNIVPSFKAEHTEMDYLRLWAEQNGHLHKATWPQNDQLRLELLRGKIVIETKTAENIAGISGQPCDGVLVTESGSLPEVIREACQERTMTRDGWICYTGTFEDDMAAPQYAWYAKTWDDWHDNPTEERLAVSLPSWANRGAFPGGRDDPKIKYLERTRDPWSFNRRIAGIPSGTQFPMYGGLLAKPREDWAYNPRVHGRDFVLSLGAGGHDYGSGGQTGHPSTLVALGVTQGGLGRVSTVVVREAWAYKGMDRSLITTKRRLMSQKYGIPKWRWGFDPMQKQAAEEATAIAMKTGDGSRLARVGMVEQYINNGTLLFDFSAPGVEDVYNQMRGVHYRKRLIPGKGEVYDYARTDDDYVAALENGIEVIVTQGMGWRPKQAKTNWGKVLLVR